MPELRLQIHGTAAVHRADAEPWLLRGRAAVLVALVALEPGVSRERAARLLWPDAAQPRHNLRQQLLRFRQATGLALIEGDEQLRLSERVAVSPALPGQALLADEEPGDDAVGDWLRAQRRAGRQAAVESGQRQVVDAERAGDLDAALRAAQALAAAAPHDEAAVATLMRVHYLRGEAPAGLDVYRRHLEHLKADAGFEPAAATVALADALRRVGAVVPAATAAVPITLRRPPRRVGRTTAWAALQQARDRGRVVVVEGEAGMGKSRLLSDWLVPLGPHLAGAGRPGDAGVPYATLARLLRPLLQSPPPALDEAGRQALAYLDPASTVPGTLRADAMVQAVSALLARAGLQTVCLDDLHFADDATIDVVAALAAQPGPPQWLLALRPAEGGAAAARLIDSLAEAGRLVQLRLQPLAEADVAQLIDDLALPGGPGGSGQPNLADPALPAALCRHTGGNPLFLLETIRQGLVDGSLGRGVLPRPDGVGVLIERRLLRLSDAALTLARVAAIAGIDFSIELAEAATGQRAVQLAGAWQELQDAQVLRDEAFAHDLVADAVLRGVAQVVARRVHAQCAQWLAGHDGEPARVARHWQLGGAPGEAAAAYRQAAARARRASRRSEEAELLQHAALCHAEAGEGAQRFDALVERALALTAARLDEAAMLEVEALEAQAGDETQRARALRVQVDLLGQRGHFERAVEVGRRGLALAQHIGHAEEQARMAGELAGCLSRIGRCDEALDILHPHRAWVDASGNDDLRHLWYGYWAAVKGQIGHLRDALAGFDQCIDAAERLGRRDAVGAAVLNQGVVLRAMGRLERAYDCSRRGLALKADDPAETTERTLARLMHARDQADGGHFADALAAFADIDPRLQAMGGGFWVVASRTAQSMLWLQLGQFARAQQALADDDAATPVWMRAGRRLLRMEIADWLGQPHPAGVVAEALELAQADPGREISTQARALRAADARQLLEGVAALADRARLQERFGVLMALHTHEARAARRIGDHARAADAARAALRLQADGFAPEFMYAPEVQLVAWQALQDAGADRDAAAALRSGAAWVRERLPQVPAAFLESFQHRNPVNRTLLAAAARAG